MAGPRGSSVVAGTAPRLLSFNLSSPGSRLLVHFHLQSDRKSLKSLPDPRWADDFAIANNPRPRCLARIRAGSCAGSTDANGVRRLSRIIVTQIVASGWSRKTGRCRCSPLCGSQGPRSRLTTPTGFSELNNDGFRAVAATRDLTTAVEARQHRSKAAG